MCQRLQSRATLPRLPRQEPLEHEPIGRQPADRQRGDRRRRPGHHADVDALRRTGPHQPEARVGDRRHASVRDQRHGRAVAEPSKHLLGPFSFVPLEEREQRPVDQLEVRQEPPVRRVSSAAIRSTAASVSTARGARSPRLPIGVPTR